MTRSRTHKDDEDLRGEIRELKAQNRALKKRLRTLEKNKHVWTQYNLDAIDKEDVPETKEVACPECGDGVLIYIDLGIKHLMSCSSCKYRTKAKNKNG